MPNLISTVTEINGKKLRKAQVNLFAKIAAKWNVTVPDEKAERVNPYTGKKHMLDPVAVALFDFIIDNYRKGLVYGSTMQSVHNPNAIPTKVWDSARHTFCEYWPDPYFDLID